MKTIIEMINPVLPTIIAGLFTLYIARYTYNKNRPLEKLEIAYNRVYYPIYRFIKMQNPRNKIDEITVTKIKNDLKIYFVKYEKYIDFSTIKTFNHLCECKTLAEKKTAYRKFVENIDNMNSYLRKRLGYLEPNILQLYKYIPIRSKISLWIMLLISGGYISLLLGGTYTEKSIELFITAFLFFLLAFILLVIRFIMFLYYKLK